MYADVVVFGTFVGKPEQISVRPRKGPPECPERLYLVRIRGVASTNPLDRKTQRGSSADIGVRKVGIVKRPTNQMEAVSDRFSHTYVL